MPCGDAIDGDAIKSFGKSLLWMSPESTRHGPDGFSTGHCPSHSLINLSATPYLHFYRTLLLLQNDKIESSIIENHWMRKGDQVCLSFLNILCFSNPLSFKRFLTKRRIEQLNFFEKSLIICEKKSRQSGWRGQHRKIAITTEYSINSSSQQQIRTHTYLLHIIAA